MGLAQGEGVGSEEPWTMLSIIQIVYVVYIVRQRVVLITDLLPANIISNKAPQKKANMNLIEVLIKINE